MNAEIVGNIAGLLVLAWCSYWLARRSEPGSTGRKIFKAIGWSLAMAVLLAALRNSGFANDDYTPPPGTHTVQTQAPVAFVTFVFMVVPALLGLRHQAIGWPGTPPFSTGRGK